MRLQVKSDLEIMTELISEYKKPGTTDAKKLIMLEDLEYLVHQVSAVLFCFIILIVCYFATLCCKC
jgi:hypothetical protein